MANTNDLPVNKKFNRQRKGNYMSVVARAVNDRDLAKAFSVVSPFLSGVQKTTMLSSCMGEEGECFIDKFKALAKLINEMPKTYEQDSRDENSMAYLHYFIGDSDWYITEKDKDGGVLQAYGYAILNGDLEMAEFGYISIKELVSNAGIVFSKDKKHQEAINVELDLHFKPCSIKSILAKV